MPHYKHILFDLDHTLWDFEKNSSETLSELFTEYKLADLGDICVDRFMHKYSDINREMWALYNENRITRDEMRDVRFERVLTSFGICKTKVPKELGQAYLDRCPTKPYLMPYTLEVLQYLNSKYQLHIITNGFHETQEIKLTTSKLKSFFKEVVTSETSGYKKPNTRIFDYTLSRIQADTHECIMIGDNLETDIIGARNASIDTVFYNPEQQPHQETVTHEVHCLSQLTHIL
jgi:putative hydrolase of the HAD superfamily